MGKRKQQQRQSQFKVKKSFCVAHVPLGHLALLITLKTLYLKFSFQSAAASRHCTNPPLVCDIQRTTRFSVAIVNMCECVVNTNKNLFYFFFVGKFFVLNFMFMRR